MALKKSQKAGRDLQVKSLVDLINRIIIGNVHAALISQVSLLEAEYGGRADLPRLVELWPKLLQQHLLQHLLPLLRLQ